jgi:hypothetical protein
MGVSDGRQSPPGSFVTAARAGAVLLVIATIAVFVALFLPWWSLREVVFQSTRTVVSTGFHGWGWLSLAATLVAFVAVVKLLVFAPVTNGTLPGRWRDNRSVAWVIVMAGTAELVGNVLFIVAAPKTEVFVSAGQFASYGIGVIIAMVGGVMVLAGGLLMLGQTDHGVTPSARAAEVGVPLSAARAGIALLPVATGLLLISLFLPWWSWKVVGAFHPTFSVSLDGLTSWGWLSFGAALLALGLTMRFFALPRLARGTLLAKAPDTSVAAPLTVTAGVTVLLSGVLFVFVATKGGGSFFTFASNFAGVGAGLIIAMVAGVMLIASGLLMLGSRVQPEAADSVQAAPEALVG